MKNIAVVTGASGGLGAEFVKIMCAKSAIDEVWCIGRNKSKLDELHTVCGEKTVSLVFDLSQRESLAAFGDLLAESDVTVKYLVNNAGYAKFCAYGDLDVAQTLNMIDLNVSAVVAMGLICLPKMTSGCKIINVASQASFQPLPYMNVYAAAKAFVRNYTRALNVELKSRGITATAVCPGWINTGLFERGNIDAQIAPTVFKHIADPRDVAAAAVRDCDKNKDISIYGAYVKLAHSASKIFSQRKMMKLWLSQQKIKNKV